MKNLVRVGVLRFCPDLYTDDFSSRRGGGDGGGVKLHISIWKILGGIQTLFVGHFSPPRQVN